MGHLPKIVTGEVVYYILSGTPRAPQKCFWSDLRVEFSGENHLLLICVKMPNQTLQLTRYLDSGLNSDLFKKSTKGSRNWASHLVYVVSVPGLVVGSLLYRLWDGS